MRNVLPAALAVLLVAGCANTTYRYPPMSPQAGTTLSNPLFIAGCDHELIWETMVEVVTDYFRVESEIRPTGDGITEGVLKTYPVVGATYLEPWRNDSANAYERLESTFQSIRRYANVRVVPAQGGYWIEVAVYKDLENNARPLNSTASAATFRYDSANTRVVNPVTEQETTINWIRQGRDLALEQRILGQLQWRFSGYGTPVPVR